ncbi:trans-2-enoyl-CoA reductase [Serratia symbiotica str. 'Cinara cedri']|nr:trans-2-enoyl-CoA reductase [Serratia symbiotica str. 'Cinara cedri']
MIIKPKIRGFICTTAHLEGCKKNVHEQITYVRSCDKLKNGPTNVLVIGASTGYGLASRITAAFGSGAATIGVFFEKPSKKDKTGSAGWYNSAGFDKIAKKTGLYAKSINGDAFSDKCRQSVIDLVKQDLGNIDLVIYSLASPIRKIPDTGEVVRSVIKTIGEPYKSITLDTNKDILMQVVVEPANKKEIFDTIRVMGGEDWQLWINALDQAKVLADNIQTIAYSYIGTDLTWPIYSHGTLGKAKENLYSAAQAINQKLKNRGGAAYVAVLKSVVTQSSSAIPVMPLYISILFKIMKEQGIHEGCIEQIQRLFATKLYTGTVPKTDEKHRLRLDDWELRADIQHACRETWLRIKNDNINQLTDYQGYKEDFLRLFGFGLKGINYTADLNVQANFDVIQLIKDR